MVNAAWREFRDEILRWRDSGRLVEFWWRDDDATLRTPALDRLLLLAASTGAPLALAVVPDGAQVALIEGVAPGVVAIQHGVDHRNRAVAGGKKSEFPVEESPWQATRRLIHGQERIFLATGARALPVLAPPWNRLSPELVPKLAAAGFRGLSTYGARKTQEPAPGLRQVNTHVDVIDWKGGRGFAGEEYVLRRALWHLAAKRTGMVDTAEPTGWLTHHAIHDEAAWRFLAVLFDFVRDFGGVQWMHPAELFACAGTGSDASSG